MPGPPSPAGCCRAKKSGRGTRRANGAAIVTLYLPYPSLQRRGMKNARNYPLDLEKSQKEKDRFIF